MWFKDVIESLFYNMTVSDKYSIVLVIKEYTHIHDARCNNLERFVNIGMKSYEKYLEVADIHDFIIITPKGDYKKVKETLETSYPKYPWKFLTEEALVSKNIPEGWARQQTAKLAVSKVVQTSHYLIIDDDTYLTKPFTYKDLFYQGRAIMNKTQIDFPFFFLWSAQIAQVDYDLVQNADFHMAITPEIFVTEVVRDIVAFLEKEYGTNMKWQEHLAENKYTEYCLYWTWLLKHNKTQQYYAVENDAPCVYGYPTSGPEHDVVSQVHRSFTQNANHFFSFVQSSLQYPVKDVSMVVQKYLQ